eukprot:NODE_2746_length_1000_cov_82.504009_g2726_i0.p1 GENE.NODE_2746_length_1000_cov_82.504009_g2726_i0~~NODE_2746_length_1000_cov_82.504009_g2726_i0.p1  ORF type:complete len:309 (+),score=82.26 NODE_2746_length_1000_cov_82.504009_g2726_i0:78-929(+)
MSRVKMTYDREVSTLNANYAQQIRALKETIYGTVHENKYIAMELEYRQQVLSKMAERKDQFNEQTDMRELREKELASCQEAFEDACQALETLTKEDMALLRKYVYPPPLVWTTLEAILEVNGEWNTTWEEAQVVLTDNYFFNFFVPRSRKYDLEGISDELLDDLENNMQDPDFQPQVVAQVCIPCQAFCKFVRAVYTCGRVNRYVKPTGWNEDEVQTEVNRLKSQLHKTQDAIAETEKKLLGLQNELTERKGDLQGSYNSRLNDMHDSFLNAHTQYTSLLEFS